MPGEIHADFSSILRDVVGRNRVSERVLLEQFYRCLDKTTKKLIQPDPKPRALEEAVDKATEIDDPMDNVVLGLVNIGQPWVIPMDGTAGQTNVLSGISGAGLAMVLASSTDRGTTAHGGQTVALFTNPQGVYNAYSGTWDPAPGHVWNGASSNGVVSNITENAELVMDAAVPAVDAANSEGTSTGDDNSCTNREGYCVERARLERREVRKQAK
ncbi:hypothetical protein PC113_g22195 [Phytophthora cactorum]|uniref:Uncharacterized protein n=1 Tax=Phytophthora cactorum TaxID=29920 RepID=A0A8T0XYN3_9STRA|nr:hypothetical protein PC113_g22195 [Phytophthora cactorum]